MQEFSFAHNSTKCNINAIFNSHFTGSVLWDLFGREAEMIYNTWNISIRKMFRLDQRSHRYFIEPISKIKHIKIAFMTRGSMSENIRHHEGGWVVQKVSEK